MSMTERTITDVKWNSPGFIVEGRLVAIRQTEFEGKRQLAYTVLNSEGTLLRFFGTGDINSKLLPEDKGRNVRIEYLTEIDIGGGRTRKSFEVQVDMGQAASPRPALVPDPTEITDADIPF